MGVISSMASHQGPPTLNQHDKMIIESIFNPNLPFDAIDPEETKPTAQQGNVQNNGTDSAVDIELKSLESDAVKAAEAEEFDKALTLFDQVIERQPQRAAAYNNRAQLYRLIGEINNAKSDLEAAIEKSGGVGSAACQAFTQRAMIRRLEGDDDGCRADFAKAAELGSKFAKQQLVNLNPYAALCNQMLSEMMCKIKRGEPEDSGDVAA